MSKPSKPKLSFEDGFNKEGFFDTTILERMYPDARYYIIVGGRSFGKTYPTVRHAIEDALDGKGAFAYIRRYKEDISDTNLQDLLAPHKEWMETMTQGQYNDFQYYRHRWTPISMGWREHPRSGEDAEPTWERLYKAPEAIGGSWALSTYARSKGQDFGFDKGGIKHIILDEAVEPNGAYINDEWKAFTNTISTLIRQNDNDTKIWLLANPVSKYVCPYFRQMGIKKAWLQTPGITEIVYPADENGNQMKAIFCYLGVKDDQEDTKKQSVKDKRKSIEQRYFAFPNSKGITRSITSGSWELADANTMTKGMYENSREIYKLYLLLDEDILCAELLCYQDQVYYIFVRPSSKLPEKTYYSCLVPRPDPYAIIGSDTGHPLTDVYNRIIKTRQVYYADLTTADLFRGWMLEANKLNRI